MTELKALLDEAADRARLYDVVASARVNGRRRRRVRTLLAAGATAIAVVAVGTAVNAVVGGPRTMAPDPIGVSPSVEPSLTSPPVPAMPSNCTVARLPLPAGYPGMARVTGGDPSGRFILGEALTGDGRARILVWDNETVSTLSMPGSDGSLVDMNSSGVGVGYSYGANDVTTAYVYHDGQLTRLNGNSPVASAINSGNVIVGTMRSDVDFVPVIWRWPSTEPEVLATTPDRPYGSAMAIDDEGNIVGVAGGPSRPNGPVQWLSDGTFVTERVRGWTGEAVNAQGWTASLNNKDGLVEDGQSPVRLPRLPDVDYTDALTHLRSLSDGGHVVAGYISIVPPLSTGGALIPVVWHCT